MRTFFLYLSSISTMSLPQTTNFFFPSYSNSFPHFFSPQFWQWHCHKLCTFFCFCFCLQHFRIRISYLCLESTLLFFCFFLFTSLYNKNIVLEFTACKLEYEYCTWNNFVYLLGHFYHNRTWQTKLFRWKTNNMRTFFLYLSYILAMSLLQINCNKYFLFHPIQIHSHIYLFLRNYQYSTIFTTNFMCQVVIVGLKK